MMRTRACVAAVAVLAAFTSCSASKPTTAAPRTTTSTRHAVVVAPAPSTTPRTSRAEAVAARNNPTHDPGKCVRLLPNGNVVVTIKDFIPKNAPEPTGPSPFGWCG